MPIVYQDVRHWLVAFHSACQGLLAQRSAGSSRPSSVWAEPCSLHGAGCVWLMYARRVGHIPWAETDPVRLAETVVEALLDQPG